MFAVVMGVGLTVSTLVVLSTLEGETIGTAYCVCGVSGRGVLSSESEMLSSVIVWWCEEVSSSMDVPSRLIPLFAGCCEPLFCWSWHLQGCVRVDLHNLDF